MLTIEAPPRCHATTIAFDIVGYGRRGRAAQLCVRDGMYRRLENAFSSSPLDWPEPPLGWNEDRGDGVLFVLPSPVKQEDIDLFVLYLAKELREHNCLAGDETQISLRMALNAGWVYPDRYGLGGTTIVTLFRILDAATFKEDIEMSKTTLGVIVLQDYFAEEIEGGSGLISPHEYYPLEVFHKEFTAQARATIL